YLRGVPFLWTLALWKEWLFMLAALLTIYVIWDSRVYHGEASRDIIRDETIIRRIKVIGKVNFLWLILAVSAIALLSPAVPVPGTSWKSPYFLREAIQDRKSV